MTALTRAFWRGSDGDDSRGCLGDVLPTYGSAQPRSRNARRELAADAAGCVLGDAMVIQQ